MVDIFSLYPLHTTPYNVNDNENIVIAIDIYKY